MKRTLSVSKPSFSLIVLLGLISAVMGCSDDRHASMELLVAPTRPALTPEQEWLHQLQKVTVVFPDPNGHTAEKDPADFAQDVNIECNNRVAAQFGITPDMMLGGTDCRSHLIHIDTLLCVAKVNLAAATIQAQPITLTTAGYNVPVQSEETSEALAERASLFAELAEGEASTQLTPATNCLQAVFTAPHPTGTADVGVADVTAAYAEAYFTAKDGFNRAVEATLNVSDKMRSSSISATVSATRSLSGEVLSRAAAAHLLVGGGSGLDGNINETGCIHGDLSANGRSALQLFRDAALDPNDIVSSKDTSDLLDGTDLANGSMRQRLGQMHGYDELTSNGQSVESFYKMNPADFQEARDYLREEIKAFYRVSNAQISAPPLPNRGSQPFKRFAGTASPPRPLPPSAWAAVARSKSPAPLLQSFPIASNIGSLAGLIWSTNFDVRSLLGNAAQFATDIVNPSQSATARAVALAPLGMIAAGQESPSWLQLRVFPPVGTSQSVTAVATEYTQSARLRIVVGEEGLKCAVQGSIDGADCDNTGGTGESFPCNQRPELACLTLLKLNESFPPVQWTFGNRTISTPETAGVATLRAGDLAPGTRLYLVQPKDAGSPEAPGAFKPVVGIPARDDGTAEALVDVPIVPSLEARVDEVLAPNPKNCSLPSVSCTKVPMDARLPLEADLTDDSNGVENSWKHYLDLAKQAADEADTLGKDYLSSALDLTVGKAEQDERQQEQQQRAEDALAQVQSDCGTAVDSQKLLSLITGGDGKTIISATGATQCNTAADCTDPKLSCIGGRCILSFTNLASANTNPADEADLLRLSACLEDTQVNPFITLGDRNMCVWTTGGLPNAVCPFPDCPQFVPPPASANDHSDEVARCGTLTPTGSVYDVYVAQAQHIYVPDANDNIDPSACNSIRRLRKSGDPNALQTLISGGILNPARVATNIGKVGWQAKFGGYVDFTTDATVRYTTGSASAGASTQWPCGGQVCSTDADCQSGKCVNSPLINGQGMCQQTTAACPDPGGMDGLFCTSAACGDVANRAAMNSRLLRATLAASIMLSKTDSTSWDFDAGANAHLDVNAPAEFIDTCNYCDCDWATTFSASTGSPIYNCSNAGIWVGPDIASGQTSSDPANLFWIEPNSSNGSVLQYIVSKNHENYGAFAGHTVAFPGATALSQTQDAQAYFWAGLSRFGTSNGWLVNQLHIGIPDPTQKAPKFAYEFPLSGSAAIPTGTLSSEAFLDGLELLCDTVAAKVTGTNTVPAGLSTLESLDAAGNYLQSISRSIVDKGQRMIFANVPKIATDAYGQTSGAGAFPQLGGKMAEQVSALRSALLQAKSAVPIITGEMNAFGSELKALRAEIEKKSLDVKIADTTLNSSIVNNLASCASASTSLLSNVTSAGASTAIACANAAAQIAFATQINDLEHQAASLDNTIAQENFAGSAAQHARALQEASISLSEAAEQIDSAAAAIEGLKKDAQVQLARAVYTASYQSQNQAKQISALGTLATAKQSRYAAAFTNAQQTVFLAKRAIEQRLGVQLSTMMDPLPLVDAPHNWEGRLCTMSGIDFEKIAAGGDSGVKNFTDGFIGDYVTKLGNVVESYLIQNDFHQGADVAVVSLRDDILNVRASCAVPSSNLLLQSAALDDPLWAVQGCQNVSFNGQQAIVNCLHAMPIGQVPFNTSDSKLSGAGGYRLTFGDGVPPVCPNDGPCGPPASTPCQSGTPCSWRAGAAMRQAVTLEPGRYRFTWYTADVDGSDGGSRAATVLAPDGSAVPLIYSAQVPADNGGWNRSVATFVVPGNGGTYQIGFTAQSCSGDPGTVVVCTALDPPPTSMTLGAPMLERLPSDGSEPILRSFQRTTDTNAVQMDVCQDTSGGNFRATQWTRECVRLCDSGFSNNCTDGPTHCYRKAEFGISQSAIQNGKIFNFSGLARGNFNYRIDQVAFNVVGTGIRNCANSRLPSTCNGGGFVTYSFDHVGPFFVRNFDGKDFRASLFDGHIEQARALASERYITNPLSSTDRSLITDYERKELQGRPLDGNFTLRIWEDDAVDFDAIQDVQMILDYTYWTRFN